VAVTVVGPAATERDLGFSAAAPVAFAPVEFADRPRVPRDARAVMRLRRLLADVGADVVHAHGLRAGALTAIALAFSGGRRPTLVVTVHNAPPIGGVVGAIYRVLELIVARNADSVLCVSADLEHRMRSSGARRVGRAVVPAPNVSGTLLARGGDPPEPPGRYAPARTSGDVSAETFPVGGSAETLAALRAEIGVADAPGSENDGNEGWRPVVLAVGRLAPQKGFGTLLEAFGLLSTPGTAGPGPLPLLVIAGDGPLRADLGRQAEALGIAVRFLGNRNDVPALLAVADVFVMPSLWEGQPLILQEALRAGRPIVAARVGGVPDLTGAEAALLVPSASAGPLADAIRSVLGDPALAARLGKAAVGRARSLPSEEDAVAAAFEEYSRLVRTHAGLPGDGFQVGRGSGDGASGVVGAQCDDR
jgi:glycosyltransferase involved in cell wall biosynthesis